MKRFLNILAAFSIIETIGRHPAAVAGSLMLLGVGGVVTGVIPLNPPTILPQPGIIFPQSNSFGTLNAGLIMAPGSMQLPATPTGSFVFEHDLGVDQSIGGASKWAIGSANQNNKGILFSTTTNGVISNGVNQTAVGFGNVA